ncbi:acetyl esterase/lipase [Pseudoduganella lurida]|uniref:Acetyl esterase/lipase n=1 Tax=Pseudoduganella lurida TaxID=1036180 RepID=A0A562RFQ9_9BURK|nr:alpha/beta hydrolase [Pseudoduganella lurida]TWI67260.1 acetyl esterase/lipase [Pseudoduganella lurida]
MKFNTISLAIAGMIATTTAFALDSKEPPKAEPKMQKVLDALASLGGKPIETLTPEEARKQPTATDATMKVMKDEGKAPPKDGVTMKQMSIDGPAGKIPLYVYTPPGSGPFPVVVYFHGGGFVIADTKTYESSVKAIAAGSKAVVVSVEYHQAPEHKFPAAPNDAFAAYQWVLGHAKEINGDASRVAVAGESAGGNLATVVSLMARDKQVKLPVHQLLIYPVVGDDMNTPSYQRNANAKPLNKPMMQWFFKHYGADPKSPYALPGKAASLKGLPPATVITAEIDPLNSEGAMYAERLKKDGVKVDYRQFDGVTHEFFGMGAVVPKAMDAQNFANEGLKKAFAK